MTLKKKKQKRLIILICGIVDSLALICLIIFYGPFGFKDWFVTTAMSTMSHKYLARTFYTEKMINNVMAKNYILDINESTDTSLITVNQLKEQESYSSVYEQEILEHEPGEDYKVIEFDGNNYYARIVVVYDPSKISLYTLPSFDGYGKTISKIAQESEAQVAINASGFEDLGGVGTGGTPTGTVIKDGKIIHVGVETGWPGGLIGFNNDNILVLTKDSPEDAIAKGMRDAIEFGPFLIVNGEPATISGNGGSGQHPRTVIAQRQDGIVLFVMIDGNGNTSGYRGGVTYEQVIEILMRYKAYNAANLDGGASTSLAIEGVLANNPCGIGGTGERKLPTAWIVK